MNSARPDWIAGPMSTVVSNEGSGANTTPNQSPHMVQFREKFISCHEGKSSK